MARTKAQDFAAADKAARTRKKNKQSEIAKGAASKNRRSEEKFVDRLIGRGFLAFTTGKAKGVPDIVAFKGRKLSFFEIKPSTSGSPTKLLFLKNQSNWIQKFCFKKKINVYIVHYKGSRVFKYHKEKINKKNISNFVDNQINRDDIKERTKKFSYK